MKKPLITIFGVLGCMCALSFIGKNGFDVLAHTTIWGDGEVSEVPEGWIGIDSADDLDNIRYNLSADYYLMCDIQWPSDRNWEPISGFSGIFDGKSHCIDGLKISNNNIGGLFGNLDGNVRSVVLTNIDYDLECTELFLGVTAGGIAATIGTGQINNCTVQGNITAFMDGEGLGSIGGVVGSTLFSDSSFLSSLHSDVDISVYQYGTGAIDCGGIIGCMGDCDSIQSAINTGDVVVKGLSCEKIYVGGIAGQAFGPIGWNTNMGDVIGDIEADIVNEIIGVYAGGIAGYASKIHNSINHGAVNAYCKGSYNENITDFSSRAEKDAKRNRIRSCAGGIAGVIGDAAITSINASTAIYADSTDMGSLVGRYNSKASLEDCYYIEGILGATNTPAMFSSVYALSEEEMKYQKSFDGLHFEDWWYIEEGQSYPQLKYHVEYLKNCKTDNCEFEQNEEKYIKETEEFVQEGNSGYILSDSNQIYLEPEDICHLSLQELCYARNEIFARHGRKFKSQELMDYFNAQSWYSGTIEPENFSSSVLSDVETQNVNLMYELEYYSYTNGEGYLLDTPGYDVYSVINKYSY